MNDYQSSPNYRSLSRLNQNIITTRHPQDGLNSFYSIEGPFLITYQHCTGIAPTDTIYMMSMSTSKSNIGTYPMDYYLPIDQTRPMHKHDYYELMLVLEGEVIHTIEDKKYQYKAGYGCLLNRSILHTEHYIGNAKILFIGLSTQLASELVEHYTSRMYWTGAVQSNHVLEFIKSDLQHSGKKKYLAFFPTLQNESPVKDLEDVTDFLISTAHASDFGSFYWICGAICKLTQQLTDANNYHVAEMELDFRPDFLLFQRINHLMEDTFGRISRNELEEQLNYSGNYINRIVKKYSGLNLFDYSMTFCMKRVEYLLRNTDHSISSIMAELDFKNPTHFYSIFKEKYGVSPGEYRKKMKDGA